MIAKAHVVECRIDRWGVDGIPTLMDHLGRVGFRVSSANEWSSHA